MAGCLDRGVAGRVVFDSRSSLHRTLAYKPLYTRIRRRSGIGSLVNVLLPSQADRGNQGCSSCITEVGDGHQSGHSVVVHTPPYALVQLRCGCNWRRELRSSQSSSE